MVKADMVAERHLDDFAKYSRVKALDFHRL